MPPMWTGWRRDHFTPISVPVPGRAAAVGGVLVTGDDRALPVATASRLAVTRAPGASDLADALPDGAPHILVRLPVDQRLVALCVGSVLIVGHLGVGRLHANTGQCAAGLQPNALLPGEHVHPVAELVRGEVLAMLLQREAGGAAVERASPGEALVDRLLPLAQ